LGKHTAGTNVTTVVKVLAREEITEWEKECVVYKRKKAKNAQQIMAPLPLLMTLMRAFTRNAVDLLCRVEVERKKNATCVYLHV